MNNLSDKETKLFIHHSLFLSEEGYFKLRDFLSSSLVTHHCSVLGIREDELDVKQASTSMYNHSMTVMCNVLQNVADGLLYGSLETFKKMVGL